MRSGAALLNVSAYRDRRILADVPSAVRRRSIDRKPIISILLLQRPKEEMNNVIRKSNHTPKPLN